MTTAEETPADQDLSQQVIVCPNCGANWLGADAEMYWQGHKELGICGLINQLVADLENRE